MKQSKYKPYQLNRIFRCGFWQGLSNVLNIWGPTPTVKKASESFAADHQALRSDWSAIGRDFYKGFNRL